MSHNYSKLSVKYVEFTWPQWPVQQLLEFIQLISIENLDIR